MDERDLDSADTSMVFDLPDAEDVEAVAAFYERTGVMPVNSIGLPIDRPIIPARRPDRVGNFQFTPGANASAPPETAEADDPEGKRIRKQFLDMLHEELKDL